MSNFIKNLRMTIFFKLLKKRRLKLGDKVKLYGGYDIPPEWLEGKDAYYGNVVGFILGPYKEEDVIIKLNEEISVGETKGQVMVLTLRYKGAIWGETEIVHLHLFDNIPQKDKWCKIDKNEWEKNHIESHATYRII